jgi:hypothetical protein
MRYFASILLSFASLVHLSCQAAVIRRDTITDTFDENGILWKAGELSVPSGTDPFVDFNDYDVHYTFGYDGIITVYNGNTETITSTSVLEGGPTDCLKVPCVLSYGDNGDLAVSQGDGYYWQAGAVYGAYLEFLPYKPWIKIYSADKEVVWQFPVKG